MLGYILDPTLQVQDVHGGTIAGAKIYLYNSNTSELATSYKDFNGAMNTNPIITDTLGNCTVIGVKGQSYDAVFKDANDNLLFSKQNLTIGNGAIGGGNTIVSAGYGIVVTPSVSGNIDTFEVAIDPSVVATISGANAIEAGDNILIKTTASGTKQINVTSAIHLANAVYQSDYKRNGIETQNILTEDYTQVKPDGVRVANDSDDNYFIMNQHAVEGGDGNDLVHLDATSLDIDHDDGTYERQIHLGTAGGPDSDWFQGLLIKNSMNSGSLSADTYDVKLQNNTGTYSLTATNQLANSAMSAAQNPGQHLSAGANINITGNTVSAKSWTNEIAQATSGKLDTSATTSWDVAAYSAGNNINITNHVVSGKDWTSAINNAASTNGWDVAAYSAGSNINITNHVISGKNWSNDILAATSGKLDSSWTAGKDVTPYSAGANINITNHVVSGKDWTNDINNAASTNGWDVTPYSGGTGISVSGHQISCDAPVYLDSLNLPTYYSFVALDGQNGNPSWLNVPNTQYQNGIVKNNNENCYSLVDRSANKMCEIDADFVIKIDAMPADSTILSIGYGVEDNKTTTSPSCRNVLFYATGIYYIHLHCLQSSKDFYFFAQNLSYLVGGGTASIYLQNVTIRSI